MKALHVFPLFGKDLFNGSEYYEYMLTKHLVNLNVNVDVCTTLSKYLRPTSAFSLKWGNDYEESLERTDEITIRRFPSSFSLHPAIGHFISMLVFNRWEREEIRYGKMLPGSKNLVDFYRMRAESRPQIYDYLTLCARGPHSLGLIVWLLNRMRDYDVIMVGFVPFALLWYVCKIANLLRKPLIILPLFHPNDLYHHFQIFYRCFSTATWILCQTSYSRNLFKSLFPKCNPVEIGAGIDQEELSDPKISGDRFRIKYGLQGKRIVLFVGRKEEHKRYDLAVQAVDGLANEQVILVMIGRDVDGKRIFSTNVMYLGNLSRQDLLDAYDACDVFLLPSEHESFGIVFLEAWMRKKPVIGNPACESIASVIQDGVDGFLCSRPEEIARSIGNLLSDPALSIKLGKAGYSKTMTKFTWSAIAQKVFELYNKSSNYYP